jgi:hypothetical protein
MSTETRGFIASRIGSGSEAGRPSALIVLLVKGLAKYDGQR